jgi:hypothetical protein
LGGGYQSVSNQRLDGAIIEWQLDVMESVGDFVRARQELSHKAELVPQIALLHTGAGSYGGPGPLFLSIGLVDHALGVLEALVGAQNVVDIRMPHQLDDAELDRYPLVVLPEWTTLEPAVRDQLRGYVERGGNLIVIGPQMIMQFEDELDVFLEGNFEPEAIKFLEYDGWLDGRKAAYQQPRLGAKAKPFGLMYDTFDTNTPSEPAAAITAFGEGRIAGLFQNMGHYYRNTQTSIPRKFLQRVIRELFPRPAVEVTGSTFIEVVLAKQGDKTVVHLINSAGHADNARVYIFDEVPPVGPLSVVIRQDAAPTSVRLEPEGVELEHSFSDGEIRVEVPRVEVHSMVVVA